MVNVTEDDEAEIGKRVALWLHNTYPRNGAKRAALDFTASPHTTRRWFGGGLPENKHMAAMARRWGKRFLAFVYEPVVGTWDEPSLKQEIIALRERLDRLASQIEDDQSHDVARSVSFPTPRSCGGAAFAGSGLGHRNRANPKAAHLAGAAP